MNDYFGDGPKLRTADVRPNIHEHVAAICRELGLEPEWVAKLEITPTLVTAAVYTPNGKGHKHIDLNTNAAVTRTLEIKVHA